MRINLPIQLTRRQEEEGFTSKKKHVTKSDLIEYRFFRMILIVARPPDFFFSGLQDVVNSSKITDNKKREDDEFDDLM